MLGFGRVNYGRPYLPMNLGCTDLTFGVSERGSQALSPPLVTLEFPGLALFAQLSTAQVLLVGNVPRPNRLTQLVGKGLHLWPRAWATRRILNRSEIPTRSRGNGPNPFFLVIVIELKPLIILVRDYQGCYTHEFLL